MEELKIGICDDCEEDRERIKEEVQNSMWMMNVNMQLSFCMYANGLELMEASRSERFPLIFLDVVMPGKDGFELAAYLCASQEKAKIVFVSGYEDRIFESYEYMPVLFARKRRLEEDIPKAMRQYFRLTSFKGVSYRMKEGFGYQEVPVSDIVYIECNGHKLLIRTRAGRLFQSYGSLKAAEEELSRYGFIRIHRSYLVNETYIKGVEEKKKELVLTEGGGIPIGNAWQKRLKSEMSRRRKE